MQAKDKIIVAVDVPTITDARSLVHKLARHVGGFKFGLEMLMAEGADRLVSMANAHGGKVFLDGKFLETPTTVARAVRAAVRRDVFMLDVHVSARNMMEAARATTEQIAAEFDITRPLVLGVTLLTTMDYDDLVDLRIYPPIHETLEALRSNEEDAKGELVRRYVKHLAWHGKENGLDGAVCSAREAGAVRKHCGKDFLIVTPGIRGSEDPADDQKRTMTPSEAIKAGSDYLVIGRPIIRARSPIEKVKAIADEIESVL